MRNDYIIKEIENAFKICKISLIYRRNQSKKYMKFVLYIEETEMKIYESRSGSTYVFF